MKPRSLRVGSLVGLWVSLALLFACCATSAMAQQISSEFLRQILDSTSAGQFGTAGKALSESGETGRGSSSSGLKTPSDGKSDGVQEALEAYEDKKKPEWKDLMGTDEAPPTLTEEIRGVGPKQLGERWEMLRYLPQQYRSKPYEFHNRPLERKVPPPEYFKLLEKYPNLPVPEEWQEMVESFRTNRDYLGPGDNNDGMPQFGQQLKEAKTAAADMVGMAREGADSAEDDMKSPVSKIEAIYRHHFRRIESGKVATADAMQLRQYGYNLFDRKLLPEASHLAVPEADYMLGPGDVLQVRMWGQDYDGEFVAEVSREGTVNLPRIGIIPVAGTRYGNVEKVIAQVAEKYIQGIDIAVSLMELRSHEIYVVGAVARPGLHRVPAFTTALGALTIARVLKTGSLRRVQLFREGKRLRTIDLYDLLKARFKGDDLVLENKDVLMVPDIGPTVAVMGAVPKQGIFELREEERLQDVLDLAGGLLAQAREDRVFLHRYRDGRYVLEDLSQGYKADAWLQAPVSPGSLIEVPLIEPAVARPESVMVFGHVWRTDLVDFTEGLTLIDVLPSAELLKPEAVTDFAILHRYDRTTTRYKVEKLPLADVWSGAVADIAMQPFDRIEILSRAEAGIQEQVFVEGAVWNPGGYDFGPGMTVEGLISLAGGSKFGARLDHMELSRQAVDGDRIRVDRRIVGIDEQGDTLLAPLDYLFVPRVKDADEIKMVAIEGEVKFPGQYRLEADEHLSDLVRRAGGFTDKAYFFGARFTSDSFQEIQQRSIEEMVKELELRLQQALTRQITISASQESIAAAQAASQGMDRFIEKMRKFEADGRVVIKLAGLDSLTGTAYDVELQDGDMLFVPARPSYVGVIGSVLQSKGYLYQAGMTVSQYLAQAGGVRDTADEDNIYVIKANGEVRSNLQSGFFSNRLMHMPLMPGDTIVVPEDFEPIPFMRLTKDITDIIFKIATTAGVAIAVLDDD